MELPWLQSSVLTKDLNDFDDATFGAKLSGPQFLTDSKMWPGCRRKVR